LGIEPPSKFKAIYAWAFIGGALLIFQLYVWIKWIAGPNFESVPNGPSEPPLFMQIWLVSHAALICIGLPISIYYFIIRPWRRDRRITLDGMLLVALGLTFFQDQFLNYLNTWCTYNTWLWNMGSWIQDVPGWLSWGEPGRLFQEPLLINAPGYSYGCLLCVIAGCWIMRRAKRIWPNISTLRLLGVLFVFTFFFDIVMEGMILMRMGLYCYPGAIKSLCLFPGHYYQYPIYQGIFYGLTMTGFCSLRYFTNDRGQTFVERGLERINGYWRQQGSRFLAVFAGVSIIFFVTYNIPTQWLAMHAEPWPEDVQERSYFMQNSFGEFTGILAPDPSLPNVTNTQPYIAVRYVNEELQKAINESDNVNDVLKDVDDELKELKYVLVFPDGREIDLPKEDYDKFPKIIPFADVPDDYEHRYVEVED